MPSTDWALAKKKYIGYSRSETMVSLMRQIKQLYDPGKLFFHFRIHNAGRVATMGNPYALHI